MSLSEDKVQVERYEAFRRDVISELADTKTRLATLKAEGKTRSATYQQLYANRIVLEGILDRLAEHGIEI